MSQLHNPPEEGKEPPPQPLDSLPMPGSLLCWVSGFHQWKRCGKRRSRLLSWEGV